MILSPSKTKYSIKSTTIFRKQLKKALKQGKDINEFRKVLNVLSNGRKLNAKYKDHALIDDKYYKGCRECHIKPDWLLIYKYSYDDCILILFSIGSHSELFL